MLNDSRLLLSQRLPLLILNKYELMMYKVFEMTSLLLDETVKYLLIRNLRSSSWDYSSVIKISIFIAISTIVYMYLIVLWELSS